MHKDGLGSGNGNSVPGEVGTVSLKNITFLVLENEGITALMLFWPGCATEII